MFDISNSSRSNSDSSTPEQSRELSDGSESAYKTDYYSNLIDKANLLPLIQIFKLYNLPLSEHNRKIICPFKKHKGGRESSPSFCYYPDNNNFYCFGCTTGGKKSHAAEFVAEMDDITRVEAAYKILELFGSDLEGEIVAIDHQNFSERLEIMMDFSNTVREFRQNFVDEKSFEFIEFICSVYDQHNLKRNLGNEALKMVVEQLKNKILGYDL
jgi:DNA primase